MKLAAAVAITELILNHHRPLAAIKVEVMAAKRLREAMGIRVT